MIGPILTIARLTMVEAARRRLLLALVVLTIGVAAASLWGFSKLWDVHPRGGGSISPVQVRTVASQLLILVAFMFAAVLALSAAVVAAPSLSGDVESGLALAMLARPIRRADLVLGKWLGLAVMLVLYTAASAGLEMLAVNWATGYVPPHPLILVLFLTGVGLALLTLSLALSTRLSGITGAVVALAGYFVAWVGGIVGGIGGALDNQALTTAGTLSRLLLPTDGLWRGAVWAMEPAPLLTAARAGGPAAAAFPFAAADPPPGAYLVWAVLWVVGVLALGVWSFHRRPV